mmetsp:Transcript_8999/g.26960  ORF Transcript_8999/g.26960 Transcript_8999/m.26960 type:complete len:430 (-) Transcript_8999:274-1563(-)
MQLTRLAAASSSSQVAAGRRAPHRLSASAACHCCHPSCCSCCAACCSLYTATACKQRVRSEPASRSSAGSSWLASREDGSVASDGEHPRRAGEESADCCAPRPAVWCGVAGGDGSDVTEASASFSRLRSARLMFFLNALLAFCTSSLAGGAAAMAAEGDARRAATAFSGGALGLAAFGVDTPLPALLLVAAPEDILRNADFAVAALAQGPFGMGTDGLLATATAGNASDDDSTGAGVLTADGLGAGALAAPQTLPTGEGTGAGAVRAAVRTAMTSSYVRATGADFAGLAALPLPNPSSRRAAAAAEARDSFFTAAALALLGAAIEVVTAAAAAAFFCLAFSSSRSFARAALAAGPNRGRASGSTSGIFAFFRFLLLSFRTCIGCDLSILPLHGSSYLVPLPQPRGHLKPVFRFFSQRMFFRYRSKQSWW